jgi:ABC-2 type transport system ATP-binding protein/lipopolysaccharide transport system ATP-binding protein
MQGIIEFCDLGHYLQMPMRSYSSGMRTRLGFAVATSIDPDILLIDEVFGAGDRRFQRKARARMDAMLGKASTLVLASHADDIVRNFCTKALWMEHGHLRAFGAVDGVLEQFHALSDQDAVHAR